MPQIRCLGSLGSKKGGVYLAQHHSAGTLHSAHGFPGSPELPIVKTKAALPRFGHAQIMLPLYRFGKVLRPCPMVGTADRSELVV